MSLFIFIVDIKKNLKVNLKICFCNDTELCEDINYFFIKLYRIFDSVVMGRCECLQCHNSNSKWPVGSC